MKKLAIFWVVLLSGCSSAPEKKARVPAMTPGEANSLLRFEPKATNWLTYVQKQNPGCMYHIELPDQSAQPTEIDLDQIVWCGSTPGPREYKASVVFTFDKSAQKWVLSRFSN